MRTNKCEIIEDLLPLYVDDVCSEETRKLITEHIEHCEECKNRLEDMQGDIIIPKDTDTKILSQIKRRNLIEKIVIGIACSIVVCLIMSVCIISMSASTRKMNDELENLISVEEDATGQLWIVKKGYAIDVDCIMADFYREDGTVIIDTNGIYASKKNEKNMIVKLQFYNSWFDYLKYKLYGNGRFALEERNKIFTKGKEQIQKLVIDISGTEHILWENSHEGD